MSAKISQAEARRLRRQVRDLEIKVEKLTNSYAREFPGTHIDTLIVTDVVRAKFTTAIRLGFPLAVKHLGCNEFVVYALNKENKK